MNRKRTPGLYTSGVRFACVPVAILACACGRIGFGGTGSDGGSADAVVPDDGALVDTPDDMAMMPIDAPLSLCPGAAVNMCDGFEATTLDVRWMLDNSMGSVALDTSRSYRGGASLHAHVNAIGSTAVSSPRGSMRSYQGLPITGITYVRVFAFFPSTFPTRFVQYVNSSNDLGLGASTGTQNRLIVNNDYSVSPSDFVRSTATQLPLDQWVCVTYQIPSDAAGTLRVSVDGVQVTDVAITPTANHPAPNHVFLGIDFPETFSNQAAADAWFDEIIVDNAPISCAD
jgi:hypothetical protein